MATLTANITTSDALIPLSAEVENGYYTIDSEAVYVTGMSRGADGRDFTRRTAAVDRGVAGTTKASHSSGATLTRYYPEAASSGGSGAVQTMRVLGPYEFNWDDAGIDGNPGAQLFDADADPAIVEAGSFVVTSWLVVDTPFAVSSGGASGKIRISPVGGASNDWEDLMAGGGDDLTTPYTPTRPDAFYQPGAVEWSGMMVTLDAELFVRVDGADISAGVGLAYVLVATTA